jgi:hypothetical protein
MGSFGSDAKMILNVTLLDDLLQKHHGQALQERQRFTNMATVPPTEVCAPPSVSSLDWSTTLHDSATDTVKSATLLTARDHDTDSECIRFASSACTAGSRS